MNRIQTFVHNWNTAPWTPRGLKFKHAVEMTLGYLFIAFAVLASGLWQ